MRAFPRIPKHPYRQGARASANSQITHLCRVPAFARVPKCLFFVILLCFDVILCGQGHFLGILRLIRVRPPKTPIFIKYLTTLHNVVRVVLHNERGTTQWTFFTIRFSGNSKTAQSSITSIQSRVILGGSLAMTNALELATESTSHLSTPS